MVERITREMAIAAAASVANGDTARAAGDKSVKQEPNEEDITEEQMEADLMKEGDAVDIEQVPESSAAEEEYDKPARPRVTMITATQVQAVSGALADWKRLAAKLGYRPDEIQYMETENPTERQRAANMLQLWFDDDEDASLENLLYTLEGLNMADAARALRNAQ